jgi:beta-aspartyl-peptidase (threonine type)
MWSLAIHGGAGLVRLGSLTPAREAACRAGLADALAAGGAVLAAGGPALDAVVSAVACLEDNPLFNAGRGSVLAADGAVRMDASLMRGADRAAGAVCDVRRVRSPIRLARAVLESTPWVLLASAGAEALADALGLERVEEAWLITEERQRHLRRALAAGRAALDHELEDDVAPGTVGAVARDQAGGLAAATSTGGLANKAPGRVGDSAVIGAGTWACDGVCAVSATGHGEAFLRAHVAARIADLMELAGLDLAAACARALDEVERLGGSGGVVAVDPEGRLVMPFRTAGMYRGALVAGGDQLVDIW